MLFCICLPHRLDTGTVHTFRLIHWVDGNIVLWHIQRNHLAFVPMSYYFEIYVCYSGIQCWLLHSYVVDDGSTNIHIQILYKRRNVDSKQTEKATPPPSPPTATTTNKNEINRMWEMDFCACINFYPLVWIWCWTLKNTSIDKITKSVRFILFRVCLLFSFFLFFLHFLIFSLLVLKYQILFFLCNGMHPKYSLCTYALDAALLMT